MSDVTTEEVAARLGESGLVLLDVRRADEFSGDIVAPCDPRPGRIPGARNIDVTRLLDASGPAAVRELVGAPEGAEVIAYCQSGSRSALAVSVLAAAGYSARNYVGSWHAWSRDPDLPAESGPTP
jgi:thiosulfate/3-mercaptopyruvate sulfurtransferase